MKFDGRRRAHEKIWRRGFCERNLFLSGYVCEDMAKTRILSIIPFANLRINLTMERPQ